MSSYLRYTKMNLCKAYPIFIILCITVGGTIAYFTGAPLMRGTTIGLLVGFAPIALLCISYVAVTTWRPDRPNCRCGQCRSQDYRYLGPDHITPETVYEYQCPSCGRKYRKKDKRFWEFAENGVESPCMVVSKWGRWTTEGTEQKNAANG